MSYACSDSKWCFLLDWSIGRLASEWIFTNELPMVPFVYQILQFRNLFSFFSSSNPWIRVISGLPCYIRVNSKRNQSRRNLSLSRVQKQNSNICDFFFSAKSLCFGPLMSSWKNKSFGFPAFHSCHLKRGRIFCFARRFLNLEILLYNSSLNIIIIINKVCFIYS